MILRRLQRDWARSRRQQAGAAAASTEAGPATSDSGTETEARRYVAAISAAVEAMSALLPEPHPCCP
eukprot:10707171-Lingulodinium_polyedra.AAC.1